MWTRMDLTKKSRSYIYIEDFPPEYGSHRGDLVALAKVKTLRNDAIRSNIVVSTHFANFRYAVTGLWT